MVGILIIAHTPLASTLKACVAHIYQSEPVRVGVLDISVEDDPVQLVNIAQEQVARLGRRHGVLVLTDLVGGTPSNIASKLACLPRVRVIAGVNLPMLVRALSYRNLPLNTLVEKTITGGIRGIQVIRPPYGQGEDSALYKQEDENLCAVNVRT